MRCSSLHRETVDSVGFSGTQCATLPAWHITSSHWEIVVFGGWCSGWWMMHPTHHTAELLPQRKLMSPPRDDGARCIMTYDVCTNSKHIGSSYCSFYVGHTQYAGVQWGRKDVFHATHKGRGKKNQCPWDVTSRLSGNRHTELCGACPWHWATRKVALLCCCCSSTLLFSHVPPPDYSFLVQSHVANQEC